MKSTCVCVFPVSLFFAKAQEERLRDYVNPFVGTDGYGNIYPGSQIPFGGIQISPDTDNHFMMLHPVINIPILPLWDSVCHI